MTEEKTLYVFRGDDEWVIASSWEDAWAVWRESTGESIEDYCDTTEEVFNFWKKCDDDQIMKIDVEGDFKTFESKTCAEWAKEIGRGILCALDY